MHWKIRSTHHETFNCYCLLSVPHPTHPPTHQRYRGRGKKILVRTVVKAEVGELYDEVMEGFFSHLRKDVAGVVQGVSFKR